MTIVPVTAKTPVGNLRYAAMKSRYLPNRAGDRRFLDRFEMRFGASVAGLAADNNKKRMPGCPDCCVTVLGRHHHGGADIALSLIRA
jgi:hypothetical protein